MSETGPGPRIVAYPDGALRRPAQAVEEIDDSLREIAARMASTMYDNEGVGIAAPQIGIGIRIVVINPTGQEEDEKVLVNPAIVERRGDMEGLEGCLSVPGVSGTVRRSSYVKVRARDLDGAEIEIIATDFLARVLQHEIDHLDGMLIVDRMTLESRIEAAAELKGLENGTFEPREPEEQGE